MERISESESSERGSLATNTLGISLGKSQPGLVACHTSGWTEQHISFPCSQCAVNSSGINYPCPGDMEQTASALYSLQELQSSSAKFQTLDTPALPPGLQSPFLKIIFLSFLSPCAAGEQSGITDWWPLHTAAPTSLRDSPDRAVHAHSQGI